MKGFALESVRDSVLLTKDPSLPLHLSLPPISYADRPARSLSVKGE